MFAELLPKKMCAQRQHSIQKMLKRILEADRNYVQAFKVKTFLGKTALCNFNKLYVNYSECLDRL